MLQPQNNHQRNTDDLMLTELIVEDCDWDADSGFIHQHFCNHHCHGGPLGFGHILVCCGREVRTDDIRCSVRCQRPHGTENLVEAPDCPHCGPWSHEAKILKQLVAVFWWFHYLALLLPSKEIEQRITELREHQARVINIDLNQRWKDYYLSTGSIHKLRQALTKECETQRTSMINAMGPGALDAQQSPLPISDAEAACWYKTDPGKPRVSKDPQDSALEEFLDCGALDFFTEGDPSGELRLDMIERFERLAHPPKSELNNRRLVCLFDREMFTECMLNVGDQRPDLVQESDRQMLLYKAEQLVAASHGYWQSIEELANWSPNNSDIREADYKALQNCLGWLVYPPGIEIFSPIFQWLGASRQLKLRFTKLNWQTQQPRQAGAMQVTAIELLRSHEQPEVFGPLTLWSPKHVATFLLIADSLQVHGDDGVTLEELTELVDHMVGTCKVSA